MESPSFVSKARTAIHSAAAKAEQVFTDIKSDFISDREGPDSDKISPKESIKESGEKSSPRNDSESKNKNEGKQQHMRWRPGKKGTKLDWQDRFKNTIRLGGKRGPDNNNKAENSTMALPFYDENLYLLNMKNEEEAKGSHVSSIVERLNATNPDTIPPISALKQLAVAVDSGKKFKSVKDILASSGASSPIMERASLSLAAVKSLMLRDKEDKLTSEFGNDEKLESLIKSLFDADIRRGKLSQPEHEPGFGTTIIAQRYSWCST